MDLKWPEMPSKVNFDHPKWPIDVKWPEMQSKVIFVHLKWPQKKNCIDLKWPELLSKVNFRHPKWPIDLKWPEMRSKVIFGHPKWPMAAIMSKFSKKEVAYRSEMARNVIESEFRTSKMGADRHFVKIKKFRIDLKWPEMRSKVNFGHPKWPTAAILSKYLKKSFVLI